MPKTDLISLSKKGMDKFLSGTELRVMDYLWSRRGRSTSTEIARAIGKVKLTTVAGILDRLVENGLVTRELDTSSSRIRYHYRALRSRKEEQRALVDRVAESMVRSFGRVAVEAFSKYAPERNEGK